MEGEVEEHADEGEGEGEGEDEDGSVANSGYREVPWKYHPHVVSTFYVLIRD